MMEGARINGTISTWHWKVRVISGIDQVDIDCHRGS